MCRAGPWPHVHNSVWILKGVIESLTQCFHEVCIQLPCLFFELVAYLPSNASYNHPQLSQSTIPVILPYRLFISLWHSAPRNGVFDLRMAVKSEVSTICIQSYKQPCHPAPITRMSLQFSTAWMLPTGSHRTTPGPVCLSCRAALRLSVLIYWSKNPKRNLPKSVQSTKNSSYALTSTHSKHEAKLHLLPRHSMAIAIVMATPTVSSHNAVCPLKPLSGLSSGGEGLGGFGM